MALEEALKLKEQGNAAYKARDFAKAHQLYDEAIKLDPTNITLLTNNAATYFEEGNFDQCIECCEKAVDLGREQRADFKLIAKALSRAANAYLKKGDEKAALLYFDKSLSEHRDPAVLKKRGEVEKIFKEKEKLAYINPELAQEEKARGNEFFKAGNYPDAMKHYNEAIKRDPNNAVLYSNRAACYTKLMEFNLALKDCDTCIEKDPKFVKAHIRKGAVLSALKEWSRAQRAYEDALSLDPNNAEARQGLRGALVEGDQDPEETRKKALNDPEVQAILNDPAMRMILEQMQNDPKAIQEHLKNPDILQKLLKLRDAGIVQMR